MASSPNALVTPKNSSPLSSVPSVFTGYRFTTFFSSQLPT
jgi:hypothetical protein